MNKLPLKWGATPFQSKPASDLARIEDEHLGRGGTQANADLLIQGFLNSFQNLADFPDIGTSRNYLQEDERAVPNGDYMIVYMKRSEQPIDILHVVWARMDLHSYFSDLEQ